MLSAAVGAAVLALTPRFAPAGVPVTWDANTSLSGIQGGSGNWNTGTFNWDNAGTAGPWFNSHSDTAVFTGTPGGTVQLAVPITAGGLRFDGAGYTVGGPSSPL